MGQLYQGSDHLTRIMNIVGVGAAYDFIWACHLTLLEVWSVILQTHRETSSPAKADTQALQILSIVANTGL